MKLPIYRFKPRYGPEWGSGGIFGLKYHKGVLYFTLAFEAEAYFIKDGITRIYDYGLVGLGPRSGGDTYNAVEAVDSKIYFGGWVHAPASYRIMDNYIAIDFRNKYSHIHSYDVDDDKISLMWKESAGLESEWVGEVSSIIFDPLNTRLLISRADGSKSLGVYAMGLSDGKLELLSDKPSLKGTLIGDMACFDISIGIDGIFGIQCMDLVRGRWSFRYLPNNLKDISVDGGEVVRPLMVGSMASAYGRLFIFVRGGVIIWDPAEDVGNDLSFVRLYDFNYKDYGPLRTNHLVVGGGILIPFNSYVHGIFRPIKPELKSIARVINYIPTNSYLIYVTPPAVKVVASLGTRITSIEHMGSKLLIAANTAANLGNHDATPFDIGERDLISIDMDTVLTNRPSSDIIKVLGKDVGNRVWGGIPLNNYKEARMYINASKDNTLKVYEYDLGLPPSMLNVDVLSIDAGKNYIDLSNYAGIVSFKLSEEDAKAVIYLILRN